MIIVDEDDDYADDESDSTKPEKGIGENEKEFAEDEEFEKMDTRDGDELCWVGPQDMEISDDDEDVSKSLTEVNATKNSKDDRKSSTIVKRVSSDSILNDPTPEQHPPVSHFQLGLNFQQDFPRAPFHTPVKISPSDSCYDFGQMQYSLDAEMSGRDAQKSSKTLPPFELKPEDLERKLSRCSGGSSTSSSVSTSSSSGHESQENGAKRQDRSLRCESQAFMGKSPEIVDGVLPNRSLAERVFSAIETSFASSQEALSSPDNMYKSVNQGSLFSEIKILFLNSFSAIVSFCLCDAIEKVTMFYFKANYLSNTIAVLNQNCTRLHTNPNESMVVLYYMIIYQNQLTHNGILLITTITFM